MHQGSPKHLQAQACTHLSAPKLLWSSLLLSTAPGLPCRSNLQKISFQLAVKAGQIRIRESAVPKSAVQARNVNVSSWEDVSASQALHCLCVPGINNCTESQRDCLWFICKSRQDTKLSSESLRVSYQFHSLPDAPFGSPNNQLFPTKCDTDWKLLQENSHVLVEYMELEKLLFSGSQLCTRPRWTVHWLPESLIPYVLSVLAV